MISDKYKFIYVRNAKTASTSLMHWKTGPIRKHVTEWYIPEEAISRVHDQHHIPYRILKDYLNAEQIDTYFSFGFVRNPYDRLFSAFNYAKGWYENPQTNVNNVKPENPGIIENNFRKWVYSEHELNGLHGKYASQHYYLDGCMYIGRFETLQHDVNTILRCIGLPAQILDRVNISSVRENSLNRYDVSLKEFVYKTFEEDFDVYKYSKN